MLLLCAFADRTVDRAVAVLQLAAHSRTTFSSSMVHACSAMYQGFHTQICLMTASACSATPSCRHALTRECSGSPCLQPVCCQDTVAMSTKVRGAGLRGLQAAHASSASSPAVIGSMCSKWCTLHQGQAQQGTSAQLPHLAAPAAAAFGNIPAKQVGPLQVQQMKCAAMSACSLHGCYCDMS